jgi:hypothetical protein
VGTGSRSGKGREERRVVTAIFSAEPHSGVVRGLGAEVGFAGKTDTHAELVDEPEAILAANVADLGSAPPPPVAEITTHNKDFEAEQLELDVQRVLSISRGGSPWLLDQLQPCQRQQEEEDEKVKVREEIERVRSRNCSWELSWKPPECFLERLGSGWRKLRGKLPIWRFKRRIVLHRV